MGRAFVEKRRAGRPTANLDAHFLPYFGKYPMNAIAPTVVQGWVAKAVQGGLSPRSVRTHHILLHSIFKAAVHDRVIAYNPCEGGKLPKVIPPSREFISREQFEKLLLTIPERDQLLLLVGIDRPKLRNGGVPVAVNADPAGHVPKEKSRVLVLADDRDARPLQRAASVTECSTWSTTST